MEAVMITVIVLMMILAIMTPACVATAAIAWAHLNVL